MDLVKKAGVHGLSVTVFSPSDLLFDKAYGFSDIKSKTPLSNDHNFYAASLSKPLFAYIVLNLVEQGLLDLHTPLITYLEKPLNEYKFKESYEGFGDLINEKGYDQITAAMCLSHTSGLPNWRYIVNGKIKMDEPLRVLDAPGKLYSYSGEGFQFLQLAIEEITGKDLEELANEYVFDPFNMQMTSFTWQDRFEGNYAYAHYKRKKQRKRRKRIPLYAAGSMDTTPSDYVRFLQGMLNRNGLKPETFDTMWTPIVDINFEKQFGEGSRKLTENNRSINLGYGLGWGLYKTPYGKAIFKEGSDLGWQHHFVLYPDHDLGVLIMSNSSKTEGIFKNLFELLAGDKYLPYEWEGYIPFEK